MSRLILSLLFLLPFYHFENFAQTVEKLYEDLSDLSASVVSSQRTDLNGIPCALIKVHLPLRDVKFEGNIIGEVKYDAGEYWVYMTDGSKEIKIKHPDFSPFHLRFEDFGIESLKSKRTYSLLISYISDDVEKAEVLFKISPPNAILTIDEEEYPLTSDGTTIVNLSCNNHKYMVLAPGYNLQSNIFQVKKNANNKIIIELDKKEPQKLSTPNNEPTSVSLINESYNQNKILEDLANNLASVYNIKLGESTLTETAKKFNVKIKKDKDRNYIELKDETEFEENNNKDGKIYLITLYPKIKESFPINGLKWDSTFEEWNKWFVSKGFDSEKFEHYLGNLSMIVHISSNYEIIMQFSGRKANNSKCFSIIVNRK